MSSINKEDFALATAGFFKVASCLVSHGDTEGKQFMIYDRGFRTGFVVVGGGDMPLGYFVFEDVEFGKYYGGLEGV